MTNHQMRRQDRALNETDTLAVFEEASFMIVSIIDDSQQPYGIPLSFVLIDKTLYLHTTNEGGLKNTCFSTQPTVSATAVLDVEAFFAQGDFSTRYRSAIANGHIRQVTSPTECKQALVALCMKYAPEAKKHIGAALENSIAQTAVWAIDIHTITGKGNLPLAQS